MNGLELAIRNALERADRSNPEIRSRIYQSARNALDAGLQKQDINDIETVKSQHERLEQTIRAIDEEELERLRLLARREKVLIESEPEPEEAAPVDPEVDIPRATGFRVEPSLPFVSAVHEERHFEPHDEGSLDTLSVSRDDREGRHVLRQEEEPGWAEPETPEGRGVSRKDRATTRKAGSFLISLFVYCVLLGVIGFGGWWVYATGMLDAAMRGSGNFELVPKELQPEDYDPQESNQSLDPQRGFSGDWVEVFDPKDAASVKPRGDAKIAAVSDSDGAAISISSLAPDQAGEVRIEIPASILRDLAGKKSVIALTLRAESDVATQIYVQCEFTTLGDCGRHRYTVSNERSDELFKVDFDGKLGPNEPGYIVLNSDLTGAGRGIRIYGIRVLPGA